MARRASAPGRPRGETLRLRRRRARGPTAPGASSWSRRAASSAWSVGGTSTSPSPDCTIAAISSTNSGLPPAAARIRSRTSSSSSWPSILASISAAASSTPSGCRPERRRPSRCGGRAAPVAPCRAAGSERPSTGTPRARARSRKTSSPHWMSSNTTTSGSSAATPSSSLRNAQAISSVDDGAAVPSTASSASAATGSSSSRDRVRLELLQHLDDGPVGDALSVGEAAAADDRRVGGGEELRHEARLAHACGGDDGDELAARPGARPLPCRGELRQLSLAADERRVEAPFRGGSAKRRRAATPAQARACPSASAARRARLRPRRRASRSVASPSRVSPGSAACCSRAATLTGSPVASRSSVARRRPRRCRCRSGPRSRARAGPPASLPRRGARAGHRLRGRPGARRPPSPRRR